MAALDKANKSRPRTVVITHGKEPTIVVRGITIRCNILTKPSAYLIYLTIVIRLSMDPSPPASSHLSTTPLVEISPQPSSALRIHTFCEEVLIVRLPKIRLHCRLFDYQLLTQNDVR